MVHWWHCRLSRQLLLQAPLMLKAALVRVPTLRELVDLVSLIRRRPACQYVTTSVTVAVARLRLLLMVTHQMYVIRRPPDAAVHVINSFSIGKFALSLWKVGLFPFRILDFGIFDWPVD